MTRLPALTGKDVVRAPQRAGFVVIRTSGSHHRLEHSDDPSRITTVPVHAGKTLKRGTLNGIIEQARLTVDEFVALL
jgi:predicted RNA binding protein YcfA (HicA-like mRNA interferase family)